jgi:hypothetical protein
MTDYVKVLNAIADSVENENVDPFVESAALRETAEYITTLEAALKAYEKLRNLIISTNPERLNTYFINGEGGTKDSNGLPERIYVCPAFGADFSVIYTRAPENGQ